MNQQFTPGQHEALWAVWQRYLEACRARWHAVDAGLDDATLSAVQDRREGAKTALLAVGKAMGAGDRIVEIRDALDMEPTATPQLAAEEARRVRAVGQA